MPCQRPPLRHCRRPLQLPLRIRDPAVAKANASSATGGEVRGWNAVTDAITAKLKRRSGNPTGANQYGKGGTVDRIHDSSPDRPTGTSRSAGLRRLRN